MTTIPGHNQILPQSGIAQEVSQHAQTSRPSPDQAAAQQQAQAVMRDSTVQQTEESERLKKQKEEKSSGRHHRENREKQNPKETVDPDPDAPGRLLDTTA